MPSSSLCKVWLVYTVCVEMFGIGNFCELLAEQKYCLLIFVNACLVVTYNRYIRRWETKDLQLGPIACVAEECRSRVRTRSLVFFLLSPSSWAVFAEKLLQLVAAWSFFGGSSTPWNTCQSMQRFAHHGLRQFCMTKPVMGETLHWLTSVSWCAWSSKEGSSCYQLSMPNNFHDITTGCLYCNYIWHMYLY